MVEMIKSSLPLQSHADNVQDVTPLVEGSNFEESGYQGKFEINLMHNLLALQEAHAKEGHVILPDELDSLLRIWLEQKDQKKLLEQLSDRLHERQKTELTFADIASWRLPLGMLFSSKRQEKAETQLSTINRQGMLLVLQEQIAQSLHGNERQQRHMLLKEHAFPQSFADFQHYVQDGTTLFILLDDFLNTLPEKRANEVRGIISNTKVSNEEIITTLRKYGVYDLPQSAAQLYLNGKGSALGMRQLMDQTSLALQTRHLPELANFLTEGSFEGGDVHEQAHLLHQTIQESKQTIQQPHASTLLFNPSQINTWMKTNKKEMDSVLSPQNQLFAFAQKCPDEQKNALLLLHAQWGSETLSSDAQQALMHFLMTQHKQHFLQTGGKELLKGFIPGQEGTLLEQKYLAYIEQLYAPNYNTVDVQVSSDQQAKLVFAQKSFKVNWSQVQSIGTLADACSMEWEIDLDSSDIPWGTVMPQHAMIISGDRNSRALLPHQAYSVEIEKQKVEGVVSVLSYPQGALGIYEIGVYQDYFLGEIEQLPEPLLIITKEQIASTHFTLLPGQQLRIKSMVDMPDPWSSLHVIMMHSASKEGTFMHDIDLSEQSLEENFTSSHMPTEHLDVSKFFASRFIDEKDIPTQIHELRNKRYPQGAPLPKAWIGEGMVYFNKTYFENKYNVQIDDIPRRFDGLELHDWLQNPAHYKLWNEHMRPEIEALKKHEVTHRLLTFHGVPDPLVVTYNGKQYALDQETLCCIAEGRYSYIKDTSGIECLSLPQGILPQHIIETAIRIYIPHFQFTQVRRIDSQHLGEYESNEIDLKELWDTATHADAIDATVRELPRIQATVTRMQTAIDRLVRQSGKTHWTGELRKVHEQVASGLRDFRRELDIFNNNIGTPEALEKRQQKFLKRINNFLGAVAQYPSKIKAVLQHETLTPVEEANYKNQLGEQRGNLMHVYHDYYDFLKAMQARPEALKNQAWTDELQTQANEYWARLREAQEDCNNERGRLIAERQALLDGGALPTDPAVCALDAQINGLANQIVHHQERESQVKNDVDTTVQQYEQERQNDGEGPGERFKQKFNTIKGDYDAGFEDGTVLFLRLADSDLPGQGSVWVKTILHNTQGGDTFTIEFVGSTEGHLNDKLGKKIPIAKTSEELGKLITFARGDVYKFKPSRSMSDLYTYITDDLKSTNSKVNDFQSVRNSDAITNKREKKIFINGEKKTAPIAYIGKTFEKLSAKGTPDNYFYSVEPVAGGMKVTELANNTQQYMDPTTFMMFVMDKQLDPYTKEEYGALRAKAPEATHKKNHRTDFFVSRKVLTSAIGKLPSAYKYKKDQESKYQSAMLYYRFTQGLKGMGMDKVSLFYLSDILNDAEGELDTNISQVIKGYQDRIGRAGEGDNAVHAVKTSEIIKKEIFEKYSEKTAYRQKAAGYLMYALNSGGPYFRNLKGFHGQAKWVEAILGKSHQQKFLALNKALLDRIRSNPNPAAAELDLLAKHELNYIAIQTQEPEYLEIFGTKFGRNVDDKSQDLGDASKASDIAKGLANKNFYEILDTLRMGGMGNLTTKLVLGGLQALSEKVDDARKYSEFYKMMVQFMVSGYGTSINEIGRNVITEIARRRGIPLGLLIGDPLHPAKTVALIDAIAQADKSNKDIPTLSSIIGSQQNTHVNNFNKSQGDAMDGIDKRWSQNGNMVMDAFNYKNSRLFMARESGSPTHQSAVSTYFDKAVFDGYLDRPSGRAEVDGQSPFMVHGIWNVSPGLFQSVLLGRGTNGEFTHASAHELWQQVGAMLNQFGDLLEQASTPKEKEFILKFLLKKFKAYFGRDFSSKDFGELETAMIHNRQNTDRKGVVGYDSLIRHKVLGHATIGKKKGLNKQTLTEEEKLQIINGRGKNFSDPIVEETMNTFIGIFDTYLGIMSQDERHSVVNKVFA